ncbi:MAG: imidazole glycerol phosphate synthase subunit HisH [Sporolactobacillus sp.]
MIGIVDYGMGNLYSLSQALKRLEAPCLISNRIEELSQMDGLILPGVGAFRDAMAALNEQRLVSFLRTYSAKKPLLGICLGMQLLFEESEEGQLTKGLSLLPGKIIRFSGKNAAGEKIKVPHMGWNTLDFQQNDSPILAGVQPDYAYFVHSYYAVTDNPEILVATADYGGTVVPAIVGKGHVFGTQFHPEKSGRLGQHLLKNYLKIVEQQKLKEEGA